MFKLRPTRRHWSGDMENIGERASRAIGWILLAVTVIVVTLSVLVSW